MSPPKFRGYGLTGIVTTNITDGRDPVLLFVGLFENNKENTQNTKDLSYRANPKISKAS